MVERLERETGQFAMAAIVWHELRYGAERLPHSRKRSMLTRYLDDVLLATCEVLPYDHAAAEWHSRARAKLEAKGKTAPFTDGLIAAIAVTRGLTLVTRNVSDFSSWESLQVETWWE